MSGRNDEQWMKERYEEVCRKNPEEYALISLKIKRFRIFNRLFGREAGDWLAGAGLRGHPQLAGGGRICGPYPAGLF